MRSFSKIDKSNMRQVILDFPKQFAVGLKATEHVVLKAKRYQLKAIVVAGIGGSDLPGELLDLFGSRLNFWRKNIRFYVHHDYGLPAFANKNTLVVCISYSGNTEEPLSSYREARQRGFPLVCIASGGDLIRWAKKDGVPCAIIPGGIQPRSAVGYQFSALCKILSNAGLIASQDAALKKLGRELRPRALEARGKALAKKLGNATPLVYSSQQNKALAQIWKIKFNENSKTLAFWNYFPELNHNEMVGYGQRQGTRDKGQGTKFFTLILRDAEDHPRIQKRMEWTAKLLRKYGHTVEILDMPSAKIYNKVFTMFLLGDWVSYHLALLQGVDPTPVALVEEFKELMKK